jgi:hypothetical protein
MGSSQRTSEQQRHRPRTGRPWTRGRVHASPPIPSVPGFHRLSSAYDEIMAACPQVWGCYVGFKRVRGRTTRTPALVCCVETKVPRGRLAKGERVQPAREWHFGGKAWIRLPTDVIEVKRSIALHASPRPAVVGPGDVASTVSDRHSTIGVAVQHETLGVLVSTAAHLLPSTSPPYPPVTLTYSSGGESVAAQVVACRFDDVLDYALLRTPQGTPTANAWQDRYPIVGFYVPQPPQDLGKQLYVLTSTQSIGVRCHGLHARFVDSEGSVIDDAICTDLVTEAGDSGCPLVGPPNRSLWGLLRGAHYSGPDSRSLFFPAWRMLFREQARLL